MSDKSPATLLVAKPQLLRAIVNETWRTEADFLREVQPITKEVPEDLLRLLHSAFQMQRGTSELWER